MTASGSQFACPLAIEVAYKGGVQNDKYESTFCQNRCTTAVWKKKEQCGKIFRII